jgi:ABC-type polysaccharide/polyol phosphate export permease
MAPDGAAIVLSAAWTLLFVTFGWYVFGRMETRFADYV